MQAQTHGEERAIDDFLADPNTYFGRSFTAMHSMPRENLVELHRQGLARRFEQQVERIAMVARLANKQGISRLEDIEDVVPLLFEHTMYKSYPVALLARQQFTKLTDWLAKLTSVDVSGVDVSACASIDEWLNTLVQQSELDVHHTSGTSGTMSFLPWSRSDLRLRARAYRVLSLQAFGSVPTPDILDGPFHIVNRYNPNRGGNYDCEEFCGGNMELVHSRSELPSADLLWLAARIRLAAAKGDLSRVEVPENLLARREELAAIQAGEQETWREWVDEVAGLQGQRIQWKVFQFPLYSIAAERVGNGERWSFAPGSTAAIVGGSKGNEMPPDWKDVVDRFLDVRTVQAYGMMEMSSVNAMCDANRYHLNPWIVPFVLDPDSSSLLPRKGVQTGRFAFFDLMADSHWGGLMTGDEIDVDFEGPCSCGATTMHLGADIVRLSDKRGGDDKISCTASPQAYSDAMQFLTSY